MELVVTKIEEKAGNFNWPYPPYFNSFAVTGPTANEESIVELSSGKALAGKLIRFAADEGRILFQVMGRQNQQIISFAEIKNLQLLSPINLVPAQDFLETRAHEQFSTPEKQAYEITFNDGAILTGDTLGFIDDEIGVYLFPVVADKRVERLFIPHTAIKAHQIGLAIGEYLIEEKVATADEIAFALKQQNELRTKRIGDYLNENQILSSEQLKKAIEHQEKQPVKRLGEALIELELLTKTQLDEALAKQKENRSLRLGEILIDMGIVDERTLKGTLAKKLGIPYVNLDKFNFDPNAIRLIAGTLAKKHTLMPLCMHNSQLVVALQDPMNIKAIDELRFVTQLKILPAMSSRDDILDAINQYYKIERSWSSNDDDALEFDFATDETNTTGINDLASRLFDEDSSRAKEVEDEPIAESDNTLVQLVNKMILDAYKDGVSDIHIETYPERKNTVVRFRKDGSLMPYLEIPANFRNALISRIKIMSNLDISERRKPQDGKLDFQQFSSSKVELRVATIPTTNGLEDIVMRVLAASKPVPMAKLGLSDYALNTIQKLVSHPHGLVLVCGPTGSGKTTTLHSVMAHINTPDRKIWTAEDPIEITQKGLRQVQVNAKIGWTFANAMRSFLRADPDVIMVGEMRDEETTKIGIEASLTGHLVLSTLHTNSAPESITRMLDLGMDPFNFADALLAILAQRLAKSLCTDCKTAYTPTEAEISSLAAEYADLTEIDTQSLIKQWTETYSKDGVFTLHKATGCKKCNQTGYRGRLGIYELMTITPNLKRMIQKRATVAEITHEALASGMVTLKQDGIQKILQGNTDIAQVRAVCA